MSSAVFIESHLLVVALRQSLAIPPSTLDCLFMVKPGITASSSLVPLWLPHGWGSKGTPCPSPPLQCEGFGVCVFTSWPFCQAPSSLQCSQAGSAKDSAHYGFLPGISNKARGRGGQSRPLLSCHLLELSDGSRGYMCGVQEHWCILNSSQYVVVLGPQE